MSEGKSDKKDYVLDLPEMTAERIEAICCLAVHCKSDFTGEPLKDDNPRVAEARAQLAEIVRRCNQFIPQVMRYKRLLDQFDREVVQPEIAAMKDSRKDARARNGKRKGDA